MRNRKKLKIAAALVIIIFLFVVSPFSKFLLSMSIMSVYSNMHEKESITVQRGIEVNIPSGDGWYPFVMTFNPSKNSVERFLNREAYTDENMKKSKAEDKDRYDNLELSIMYNFPEFDLSWGKGCSRLYDKKSPYYNSFYGAYAAAFGNTIESEYETEETPSSDKFTERIPFGFNADGSLHTAEIGAVAKYDFQNPVLGDFGIKPSELVFEWTETAVYDEVDFLGENGWQRVDADLTVNGVSHCKKSFAQSYLQYGTPNYDSNKKDEPFIPIKMKGRIYAKYLPKQDISLFFYIVAADEDVLESCDSDILRRSTIREVG